MHPIEVITDTQTEIKLLIKDNLEISEDEFKKKADRLIKREMKTVKYKGIDTASFRINAYTTLSAYAILQFNKIRGALGVLSLKDAYVVGQVTGLPKGAYQTTYKNRVKTAYTELINSDAKYSKNVSLRNVSEQIVRQADFDNNLSDLKEDTNLVIMSVHADCADDHKDWQGKVYSLDGTTGRTADNRKYVPIETVTTEAPKDKRPVGKYNCRHTFSKFEVYKKPKPISAKTRKKQSQITQTQRKLERGVRKARENYLMYKDVDPVRAKGYRTKSINLRKQYEDYSKKNNRAFYRSRLSVI